MDYKLIVPLTYLSDENPEFKRMGQSLLASVYYNNYIPSYATSITSKPVIVDENGIVIFELPDTTK